MIRAAEEGSRRQLLLSRALVGLGFNVKMLAACVAVGGSISGEHGIGIEKNNYMPWIFSESDLDAQRRLKSAFDPGDLMNPFKVFPTPITCGELMTRRAPRLAASGLWI